MLARTEHFFRRMRRRVSRAEWAIRILGLPVSEGTATEPGLVLVQIDGLSRRQMERAIEKGQIPFLKRLLKREHYVTKTFYPGLPSSTPAVQAELFYGERCAVPAFSFFDKEKREVFTMFTPDCAKEIQARVSEHGEGLLTGGSSWSNIYSGGASEDETHFCASGLGMRDIFSSRPVLRALTFPIFHFPSVVKLFALLIVEFFIAAWDLVRGLQLGESIWEEIVAVFKRVFICIGLRELLTIGAKIDTARGLPVIHVNFLGYDEQSHRRGPSSAFAHWSLSGIDRAIKNIYRTAHRSTRREYQVWVFSDHGQEDVGVFDVVRNEPLEDVIERALLDNRNGHAANKVADARSARARMIGGRTSRRGLTDWFRTEMNALFEERPFSVAALGPVGHVYFKQPVDQEDLREIAQRLVDDGGAPSVLVPGSNGRARWIHAGKTYQLPDEFPDSTKHPDWAKELLRHDLVRLCEHKCAGDLILVGFGTNTSALSFVNERGAHAGPGVDETQGFVVLPSRTRLPNRKAEHLRPTDLRRAVRHFLGRENLPASAPTRFAGTSRKFRVMTYNVHSCLGMDGRISPKRIASVIERYRPDMVALQELDLGRARSFGHDQPQIIADEVRMEFAFCPTVVREQEQYGHAVLSRHPMKLVRTDILRSGRQPARVQPRGALWVQLELGQLQINLMNTHFGLRRSERVEQATDLLSTEWIGALQDEHPVILCGDFNMFPGSRPYRALTRRLRDVQRDRRRSVRLNTFSTIRPMVRIDHIFISRQFVVRDVQVPRNHLTRVASDHLPLIVDLEY